MDIVFLIYGLAFLTLGLVVALRMDHESQLELSSILGLLAVFGFIHGFLEWTDLWRVVRGDNPILAATRPAILLLSYLFLFEFGRRLLLMSLSSAAKAGLAGRLLGAWIHAPLVGGVLAAMAVSDQPALAMAIGSRYLVGFFSSAFTGVGFHLYWRNHLKLTVPIADRRVIRIGSEVAAASFIVYAIVGGLVVPPAGWFPASVINQETFLATFHFPVQLLRAICAVLAAVSVGILMRIFLLERLTSIARTTEEIERLAFSDPLTKLPNRRFLTDRLHQALPASTRSKCHGALLLIDLDNFKTLNDTVGHDMGDLLLKQVAQRLRSCVRAGDTVARLGGDEFMVMLENLNTSEIEAAEQAGTVGETILSSLNQSYPLGEVAYRSTPSIGVTLFRNPLISIDDLMKQVELAMYKSKSSGRNQMHFFDPAMEAAVMANAELEKDLRLALTEQQFLLHYQAQIVGDKQLTGAEVLVRWRHPQRGLVPPTEFIPIAEETGLILQLGQWVLEAACTQLALWAAHPGMAHLTVAVNVSAHQFRQPDFVETVLAVISQTGANPARLKLELTESMLVTNVEDIIEKMFMLKARGVGFSLDDFGTGYSSLSYLKKLPLDQLKIDQSFVRDVLFDQNDATIAKTIIALAHNLGLSVIAEGVETAAQRDFLASSGCHAFQGYFFSRPLPLAGFEEFARRIATQIPGGDQCVCTAPK